MTYEVPAINTTEALEFAIFLQGSGEVLATGQGAHRMLGHHLTSASRMITDLVHDTRAIGDRLRRTEFALEAIVAMIVMGHLDSRTSWHNSSECYNATKPCSTCQLIDELLVGLGHPTLKDRYTVETNDE